MFRPHWVCPAQGCLCFPRLPCSGSRLLYMSGPCAECGSSFRVLHNSADSAAPAFCAFPSLSARAARGLALSPRVRRAFSLRGPSAPQVGSQGVFRQEPGPVCRVGGGGFSGAEFAPFPSPCLLPPAGMGQLFSGVSQSLSFANRRQCVRTSQFFLALPQFKKAPSDCSQGLLAGPYPKQCRPLLSVLPPLAGGNAGVWGTFLLGVAFRHVICGPYLIFPPS